MSAPNTSESNAIGTAAGGGVALFTKLSYGFGALAYGIKDTGFGYLLLVYYNQVHDLPAEWVGAGIFAALLFDAFSDPAVGYVSDNTHSRWGRRHPYMYAAILPAAAAYYLLWNPPSDLGNAGLFAFFVASAVLVRTCITFYEIPSTSLVSELTSHYDERTSLLSYRFFFGWWGGLTMAVLAYLVFLPQDKGGVLYEDGYRTYGLVSAVLMAFAMLVSSVGTHRHIPDLKQPPPPQPFDLGRLRREFGETLANRSFLALFVSAIFTAMAAGLTTSLSVYFSTFFWEFETWQIGLLALPGFLSAAVALVAAPRLSARLGKKPAGVLISGVAFLFAPMPLVLRLVDAFPANGTPQLFYTLLAFNAFEVSLIITASILISAMVADVVEESELQTGRRSEGVFFAARSFAQKAVHGLGTFAASMILLAVAFPVDAKAGAVAPETIRGLALIYIPVLMVLYTGALGFLTLYRISREAHADNLRRLADPAQS
jgi:Na+/melibiose symporter-like transporter